MTLGVDLTSTDVSKGYKTCSKSKINLASQGMEENNVLPSQTMTSDDNEEALAGAVIMLSLLSPPTDNSASENLSQSSAKMKCYYHHRHHCFLDYFNDPIPDDAVIYTSDIPFHYNKIEGRCTEFIGNPIGTVFIAAKRAHKFFSSQSSNKIKLSSNSINFAQKWDTDAEYLGKFIMAISSHRGTINFVDPTNSKKVHEELMSQAAMALSLHSSLLGK